MTATYRTFDLMADDERHLGWGYIGERRRELEWTADPDVQPIAVRHARVAQADATITAHAEARSWSDEDLFTWANSKNGRWFADCVFGGGNEFPLSLLTLPSR